MPSPLDLFSRPAVYDPNEVRKLEIVTKNPVGTEVNRHRNETAARQDLVTATSKLSEDFLWLVPGMTYGLTQLDRSLFELFHWAGANRPRTLTHQVDRPLWQMPGANFTGSRWAHTIQGIDAAVGAQFRDYIGSYQLKSPTGNWKLNWQMTRMADPFWNSREKRGVDVWFLLPHNLDTGRHFRLLPPTLTLDTPSVEVVL